MALRGKKLYFLGCILSSFLSAQAAEEVYSGRDSVAVMLQTPGDEESLEALEDWKAGTEVSAGAVKRYGLERCFASCELTDAVFRRMDGRSYQPDCPVPRHELRYVKVLHYGLNGEIRLGELVCHRRISGDMVAIFRILFEGHYPIERMLLVDEYGADDELSMRANNTSCFNFRRIEGTRRLSKHSYGCAIDINPLYNPYVYTIGGRRVCRPETAFPYTDRRKNFPCKIDREDLCYKTFRRYGYSWGGDWSRRKDYQHFEKTD